MTVRNPEQDGIVCDLCGSGKFQELHSWGTGDSRNPSTIPIAVWKCVQCQLVMLYPVPTCEQMPDHRDWWSPQRKRVRRNRRWKLLREAVRRRLFGATSKRLIRATLRVQPTGRLLDVGAGTGRLLQHARKYFDCVALEPSPIAAAALRDQGYAVWESTLEDTAIPPESFDVIVLDSVIEHVTSPTAVLRKLYNLLRPGGVVCLKTPKFGGPAYRIHRADWNGFRHGHHTFLFSGATLAECLQAAGFEVLRRPRRDRLLDDVLILWGRKSP